MGREMTTDEAAQIMNQYKGELWTFWDCPNRPSAILQVFPYKGKYTEWFICVLRLSSNTKRGWIDTPVSEWDIDHWRKNSPKRETDNELLQKALLRLEQLGEPLLEKCGCCGRYHPSWFKGDCRDDVYRYTGPYGERE